jgi:hypothetical protein
MSRIERLRKSILTARTLGRLGLPSVARVAWYRAAMKSGLHPVLHISAEPAKGPYFSAPATPRSGLFVPTRWQRGTEFFSAHRFKEEGIPDWHANPFQPGKRAVCDVEWHRMGDFDPAVGDIKIIWELSRFDWLLPMAQRAAAGDASELARLNSWLDDWSTANTPYLGPNWKCGQEAAIRVMHLAIAAIVLQGWQTPEPGLLALLQTHLQRIAPTMGYAIGQDNNHGTSEAAALFIGGSWLARHDDPRAARWAETGRRWLENRAAALIAMDGTFSQYSVVYHRLMLDTYSACEVWRRRLDLAPFSSALRTKLQAAVRWQQQMLDPDSGRVPNLGANDGARILSLIDEDFRDFRSSTQLAAALFCEARAIEAEGPWDQALDWLQIPRPRTSMPVERNVSLGGFHVMRAGNARCYFRTPRFDFRPSQCDALHVDLWIDGENLLRDGGTYSYNGDADEHLYFSGVKAHNVVEFDGRDSMPRISRFLFGRWLDNIIDTKITETGPTVSAEAGYRDRWGARHLRQLSLAPGLLRCVDRLDGTARKATIRWRLAQDDWKLDGHVLENGRFRLKVAASLGQFELALTTGAESLHYLEQHPIPVLEIYCPVPSTIITELAY